MLFALPAAPASAGGTPPLSTTPEQTVGFDGLVYASVHVGDTVYLGGNFTHAYAGGQTVKRKRLAAVDARTGKLLPWSPVLDGTVLALTAHGKNLYVTGEFTKVNEQPRARLAAVDLSTGAVGSLRPALNGFGHAVEVSGGRLFVGGRFTAVNGRAARSLAAIRLADGTVDTGFTAGTDGKVLALAAAGNRLYVGGAFKKLAGAAGTARLGALKLADGKVDTTFKPGTPYPTFGLTVTKDRVFAALAGAGGRVAAYRPDGGLVWTSVTDGDVQAITHLNGTIYAGGHFTTVCSQPSQIANSWCKRAMQRKQSKMAAWDSATGKVLDWDPRSNGKWGVLTMKADMRQGLTVGGDFTAFGTRDQKRFARFLICRYGCPTR
ncbi:hypothetical protein Aca07nite_57230 [Actinoplanes capillaceus]|uniref:Uncharacterized protein n=2 Tax=Actinoplanes campanulatus TaxID=113559 RepID=A0ABQ3WQC1_9ACTN|nr:hypothetical protein Aca07nite_57230 [Actinoplanes capillaceus]